MTDSRELHLVDPSNAIFRTNNVIALHEAFSVADSQQDIDRRFGYRIGKFHFVLEKSETTEILIDPPIYKIPNSPYWLNGMLNLRSNILAVVDISKHLGITLTTSKGKFVLVIGKGNEAFSLLVDELPKLLVQPQPQTVVTTGLTVNNISAFLQPGVIAGNVAWVEMDITALLRHLKTHETHREPTAIEFTRGD